MLDTPNKKSYTKWYVMGFMILVGIVLVTYFYDSLPGSGGGSSGNTASTSTDMPPRAGSGSASSSRSSLRFTKFNVLDYLTGNPSSQSQPDLPSQTQVSNDSQLETTSQTQVPSSYELENPHII